MSKSHPFHRYIIVSITICLLSIATIAQNPVPDPNNTFGAGTTMRVTTSTNPETFIPETKTEYFDNRGILRREDVQTKDLDGNTVTITKKYDETGTLTEKTEIRRDADGRTVYRETLYYGIMGNIVKGGKEIKKDGRWFHFRFDVEKQEYKYPVTSSITAPSGDPNQMYCNCSPSSLNAGYSYLKLVNAGNTGSMPLGAEVGFAYRVNNRFNLILDVSGHCRKENDQTWSRWNVLGGAQYEFTNCEEQERISLFSRVALGIVREQVKFNSTKSSGHAFAAALGTGADVNLSYKVSARINVDWNPTFFNKDLQNNFRIGAGIKVNLGDCRELAN